jgi:hypothetical protein
LLTVGTFTGLKRTAVKNKKISRNWKKNQFFFFFLILPLKKLVGFWSWWMDLNPGSPKSSVADPDPSDPYVFGPPGSGSARQRYGSGSGSFYHQAKIVRKTLIPTVFWLLFDFLSLKIM